MSEDRAYTVHTDTLVGGEPTHRDGVVLACHPGAAQGVVSPQPLSVECGTDGRVTARWNGRIGGRFEVEGDLSYEGASPDKTWDAAPLAAYTIRVRALWDRAGQDPVEGPWTVRQSTTCPRFAPQNVTAQCTQGVVKVSWDKIGAAGKYRVNGPAELVGATGRQEVTTHGDNPQAARRSVHWLKNEGDTFDGITVQAHMNGDWSTPPSQTSAQCGPFDPVAPQWSDGWMSPNGSRIEDGTPPAPEGTLVAWDNPDLFLDSYTCGTRTTTTTGSTRTCAATWAEVTPITLTAQHHGSGRTTAHGAWGHLHLLRDDADSPYYASIAPHRHCDSDTGLAEPGATCVVDTDDQDNPLPNQAPIIGWHPSLESAGLALWQRIVLDVAIGTAIGVGTGGLGAAFLAKLTLAGYKLLATSVFGAGLGTVAGFVAESALRTSDVNVNIMAPNCLASSDFHDGSTWVRQSRSSQPVPASPVPDPSRAYVPISTQFEYDGHITVVNHTIDFCAEATE